MNGDTIKMMHDDYGAYGRFELYSIQIENGDLDGKGIEDVGDLEVGAEALGIGRKDLRIGVKDLGVGELVLPIGELDLGKGVEDLGKGVVDVLCIKVEANVVYMRDKDEETPIGEPLSLTGPSRPIQPLDPITMCFFHKRGWWHFTAGHGVFKGREKDRYEVPLVKRIPDPNSKSIAVVCYGLYEAAVDALLEFKFESTGNWGLQILSLEIYATTNGNELTKRVLRSFGPNRKKKRLEGYEELYPGQELNLDRSRLAMPMGSVLGVGLSFEFRLLSSLKKNTRRTRPVEVINDSFTRVFTFHVPEKPSVESTLVFAPEVPGFAGPALNMKLTWCHDLCLYM